MIEFRTLEKCSLHTLTEAFNTAFQEYFVPVTLTAATLHDKITSEGIDLSRSVGAYDRETLVGFILHGIDTVDGHPTAYNAGTGVIPAARGQALTCRMYDFVFPRLAAEGIRHHVLEAICENTPAIHNYEKVGFRKARKVDGFKGKKPARQAQEGIYYTLLDDDALAEVAGWIDCRPTWQNSLASVRRAGLKVRRISMWTEDRLVGFIVLEPKRGRVKVLAVHPEFRGRGLGRLLFSQLGVCDGEEIGIYNIDENATRELGFLKAMGLEYVLSQFEMKMEYAG